MARQPRLTAEKKVMILRVEKRMRKVDNYSNLYEMKLAIKKEIDSRNL